MYFFIVTTDKCVIANILIQSTEDLGRQIAFICVYACFESHYLISNATIQPYFERKNVIACCSPKDILKLTDSGFLAFTRVPNVPPSTSADGSLVTTVIHLKMILSRQKPVP